MKVFAFLLYSSIIASNQLVAYAAECPAESVVAPCKCYPKSQQIVCSDDPALNDDKLAEIGAKITGNWLYLYIHGTKINNIKANAFSNAKFNNIFIVSNPTLASIDPSAFQVSTTTKLIIRDNKILNDHANLFAIVKKLGKSLQIVELDKNALTEIPANAFNDEAQKEIAQKLYQELVNIRLDAQQGSLPLTKIGNGAFADLPKLKQLSLDNNKINAIGTSGIDLSKSALQATDHISLFLNDNQLTETTLTPIQIKLPAGTGPSVGLVLNNNKIKILTKEFIEVVSSVAHKKNGKAYLHSATPPECKCDNIDKIVDIFATGVVSEFKDNIEGLDQKCLKVEAPTTIDKCK